MDKFQEIKQKISNLIKNIDDLGNKSIKKELESIQISIDDFSKRQYIENSNLTTDIKESPSSTVINKTEEEIKESISVEETQKEDQPVSDSVIIENTEPNILPAINPSEEEIADSKPIEENKIDLEITESLKTNEPHSSTEDLACDNKPPLLINQSKKEHKKTLPTKTMKIFQAKNGMVGQLYSLELTELSLPSNISIEEIRGLEKISLEYSKENSEISGTPSEAGDFEFTMVYSIDETRKLLLDNRQLKLLINPNPRSLWKTLEPPKTELYPKKHFDFFKEFFQDYIVVGGSQRGRSHAHVGTFRDDDFIISAIDEHTLFIAVADGAGSSKYSREGSAIACKKASEVMQHLLKEEKQAFIDAATDFSDNGNEVKIGELSFSMALKVIAETRKNIQTVAEDKDHLLKDYSTTFLFTVIFKLESKYLIIAFSIGDGIIAYINDDKVTLLSNPDGGEFAGQTRFLTMKDALEPDNIKKRIKIEFVDDLSGLYLMTDGISDPKFETDANFSKMEKWKALSKELEENIDLQSNNTEKQFEEWLSFWSKGNHDDRTIAYINQINKK